MISGAPRQLDMSRCRGPAASRARASPRLVTFLLQWLVTARLLPLMQLIESQETNARDSLSLGRTPSKARSLLLGPRVPRVDRPGALPLRLGQGARLPVTAPNCRQPRLQEPKGPKLHQSYSGQRGFQARLGAVAAASKGGQGAGAAADEESWGWVRRACGGEEEPGPHANAQSHRARGLTAASRARSSPARC